MPPAPPWLRRTHRFIGLTSGAWLALIGLTGTLLVVVEPLDRALNPGLLTASVDHIASLDAATSAARDAAGARTVTMVAMPLFREAVYDFRTEDGTHVYVDAAARVTGARPPSTSPRSLLLRLHQGLIPERETWTGVAAAALLAMGVSGLFMRSSSRQSLERLRAGSTRAARNAYHIHNLTGSIAAPFLLLSATTGLALLFYVPCENALNSLLGSPPTAAVSRSAAVAAVEALATAAVDTPLERCLRDARTRFPGATVTWVTLPTSARPRTVVRLRQPEEWQPHGRTLVTFDANGRVTEVVDARTAPLGTRLMNLVYPTHILSAGVPGKLICAMVGLAPALLFASGLIMARRRRARAS